MLNTLDIDQRIAVGKQREAVILAKLNKLDIKIDGAEVVAWQHATEEEDRRSKIDAWALLKHSQFSTQPLSVQIKSRDKSSDLGIACVRPYTGYGDFLYQWEEGQIPYDRDYRSNIDLYVILTGQNELAIVDAAEVKDTCDLMLARFAKRNIGFINNSFTSIACPGVELKLVRDKGEGYTHGQQKIICYIPINSLLSAKFSDAL